MSKVLVVHASFVIALASSAGCSSCSKKSGDEQTEAVNLSASTPPAPPPVAASQSASAAPVASVNPLDMPVPGEQAVKNGLSGTLKADPNPVPICDKDGLGKTDIYFTAVGTKTIEIRVAAPNGNLLATTHAKSGHFPTAHWVSAGMTFYLQDGASDRTPQNTLARLTVDTVPGGKCP